MTTTTTRSRCKCGKACSKHLQECPKCFKARMGLLHAAAVKIVQSGACPQCGAAIRRNLSMAGWWQCAQYGAVGFRADAQKPSCNWQVFTE